MVTGLRFEGEAALDIASDPYFVEARPRPTVERFDVRSGQRVLGPLTLGLRQSSPLLATGDGRRVLTAGDGKLVLRDARTLKPLPRVEIGSLRGSVIALAADDRTVAVGGEDGSVRFVDLRPARTAGRQAATAER